MGAKKSIVRPVRGDVKEKKKRRQPGGFSGQRRCASVEGEQAIRKGEISLEKKEGKT